MEKELTKIYQPKEVEKDIYKRWEESGFLNPDNIPNSQHYCNILPPPNANGELHIGHASGYTVMDIFGRHARMHGKKTLLLPGKDHAGIQTQVVFEKILQEQQGIDRQALGREKFYDQTYAFCMDRANYMRAQEKSIGISADWSREKFTLEPNILENALKTFVQMHDDELIYKGKRIINWCPRCASALSDVEVLHKESQGKLFYIKYPLETGEEHITVATTRPETMLGDTAVAVNPDDERYKLFVGKKVTLPLMNRAIPVIADSRIDASFGTGAVKITPAHDPLDWEIGKDNELAVIQVIDEKSTITQEGGQFAGMTTHEAREAIIAELGKKKLLEKTENLTHSVSICERCKTVIEPLTSSQWFINVDASKFSLKKKAIEAIEKGEIEIFPENFKKILIDWFGNMRDWCISRQIWWGPQFPVWHRIIPEFSDLESLKEGKQQKQIGEDGSDVHHKHELEYRFIVETKEDFDWINANVQFDGDFSYIDFFDGENRTRVSQDTFTVSKKEAPKPGVIEKVGKHGFYENKVVSFEQRSTGGVCHYEIEFKGIVPPHFKHKQTVVSTDLLLMQNEETPTQSTFIGLDGPQFKEGWIQDENTFDTWFTSGQWAHTTLESHDADAKHFYPSDMMIMGRDLLFFWASRMIMMSLYHSGNVPFKTLYFTGLIRDKEGHKFSKSRGNGIDPLVMIDKYGADALRMSLVMDSAPGQDSRLYEEKIESFRNFTNKLWNIYRYCQRIEGFTLRSKVAKTDIKSPADAWILYMLNERVNEINQLFESKQIGVAADILKNFTWNEFADWYVEIHKIEQNHNLLGYVFDRLLRLWHPFMPFITEHIWAISGEKSLLMMQDWPVVHIGGIADISQDETLIAQHSKIEKSIKEIVIAIRNIRTENGIKPNQLVKLYVASNDPAQLEYLQQPQQQALLIKLKTGIELIEFVTASEQLNRLPKRIIGKVTIFMEIGEANKEKEIEKTKKEIATLEKNIDEIKEKLSNEEFTQKAPEKVVNLQKELLEERKNKLIQLKKHLSILS